MAQEQEVHHGRRSDGGLHVAMFPFFAFGHISPFVQLSKKLAAEGVKVSFLSAPVNVPRIRSLLSSASVDGGADAAAAVCDVIPLLFPDVDGLPPGIQSTAEGTLAMAELLKRATDLMKPQVQTFLADVRPHAIVHDFAHQWLPSIAHPLGVKTVFFSVFAAVPVAYLVARSDRPCAEDLLSPPAGFPSPPDSTIDGVPPYQLAAGISYMFESFHGMPSVYDRVVSCMTESSAVLIKSCREMEAPYLDYLAAEYKKPILLSGPMVPGPPLEQLEERWAAWLGRFPEGSVILCSFGSESFLTDEGITELAVGLELTGMPFLLVINFPSGVGGDEEDDVDDGVAKLRRKLPEGFEERVARRGAVHSGWVQQQHILAHPSVGCFLCHAGLSSIVEGLASGCRLVLLPQKNDQFMNARLFAGDLRAAVEVPRRREDGAFTREDVSRSVRKVMAAAGGTVEENTRRLREFLLDESAQSKYTTELVGKLREMAGLR